MMPMMEMPLPPMQLAQVVVERPVAGNGKRGLPPVSPVNGPANAAEEKFDRVIGVCHLSENPFDPTSAVNVIAPWQEVKNYYRVQEHLKVDGQVTSSVLQMPAHGSLEGPFNKGSFVYYPEKGYIGNDRATLLIEVGGKKIRMEYFFRVMQTIPQEYESEPSIYEQGYCPKKARIWKISFVSGDYWGPAAIGLLATRTSGSYISNLY